jgi:dTDP-glucose 4,6-dehydratase
VLLKILVTGGAGFIGSNFIRYVLANHPGDQIVNFDKLTYAGNLGNLKGVDDDPRCSFVKGDICDASLLNEVMPGCDAVVHFAAESHVDRSIYEPGPAVQTNVYGTFTLLNVARQARIQKFVHVSTDEVYGDLPAGAASDENYPLAPNSPYSATKAGSDLLVRSYVRTYRFPAVITRSSNNYGPYQFPEKFVPLMICNAFEERPLPVYGDGGQERDWLHVEDNCRGIYAVLQKGQPGEAYNIGGGSVEKNLDMVRRILKIMGKPESLISYVTDRPGHDRRYALDCSKIDKELGWKPEIPLERGLCDTVGWYKSNAQWLNGVRSGDYASYYERYYTRRDASLEAIAGTQRSE